MRPRALVSLAVVLSALVAAPRASADADPASDILLGSPVFYPFQPTVSTDLQHSLERALSQLRSKGLNLKVAIIDTPVDLAAVANMFGKPQTYADFLDREISFNQSQPLLVVMPAGFGVARAGPSGALSGVKVDSTHQSDGLARSAIVAVAKIAQANGKPISTGPVPSAGGGSGGTSPLITFGGPALLVVLGALAAGLLRRRTVAAERETPAGEHPEHRTGDHSEP